MYWIKARQTSVCVLCCSPLISAQAALLFLSVVCSEECWQLQHHPQLSCSPLRPLQGCCNAEQTGYKPAVVQRHMLFQFVHFPGRRQKTAAKPAVTSSREGSNSDNLSLSDPAVKSMLKAEFDISDDENMVSSPNPVLNGGNEMAIWYLLLAIIHLRLKMLTVGV